MKELTMQTMTTQSKKKPWLAVAASALVLLVTGCANLPSPPQPVTRYDLGSAPALATAQQGNLPPVAMAPLQAPLQIDGSTGLHYRLNYADPQVLYSYTQARWSQPPAQIVQQRLREHLGQGGRVVLSASPGEIPPSVHGKQVPMLRLSLDEFSQTFTTTADSAGWVRVRASLVDPTPRGDVLLAHKVFEVRQPATSADASGGVQALAKGVDNIGQQLGAWLQTVLAAPQ